MWTNDAVLRLIDLYKSFEWLWDTTNDGYKNKIKKNEAWDEIAREMDMPRREAEMKIHSLRSQFIRERKKMKITIETGGIVKTSTWFAYNALMFLLKGDNQSVLVFTRQESNQGSPSTNDSETEQNQLTDTYIECDQRELKKERKRPNEDIDNSINHKEKKIMDEFDIYGQYVASELRNVKSEQAMLMAKHYINNIILDARRGKLETDGNYVVKSDLENVTSFGEKGGKKSEATNENVSHLNIEVKCEPTDDVA